MVRLVRALLVEVNDEVIAAPRRYMAAVTLTPLVTHSDDQPLSLPADPELTTMRGLTPHRGTRSSPDGRIP